MKPCDHVQRLGQQLTGGHLCYHGMQAGNETKVIGLFLVPGIAEDYAFCSQTQGEVYQFAWFRIQVRQSPVLYTPVGRCLARAGTTAR